MTLAELASMRRIRAVPGYPIVLTASDDVYKACAQIGLPVMWTPGFSDNDDFRPLHGIPLWLIDTTAELNEKIKEVKPRSMWITGRFGFEKRISDMFGERVIVCT